MSTTTDRIAVLEAIDAFVQMANDRSEQDGKARFPSLWEDGRYDTFSVDTPGQKNTRIVITSGLGKGQRSVHCFVDNFTGDVFKAAGWKAPAKGARYNLLNDFAEVERNFDTYGRYLYNDYRKV